MIRLRFFVCDWDLGFTGYEGSKIEFGSAKKSRGVIPVWFRLGHNDLGIVFGDIFIKDLWQDTISIQGFRGWKVVNGAAKRCKGIFERSRFGSFVIGNRERCDNWRSHKAKNTNQERKSQGQRILQSCVGRKVKGLMLIERLSTFVKESIKRVWSAMIEGFLYQGRLDLGDLVLVTQRVQEDPYKEAIGGWFRVSIFKKQIVQVKLNSVFTVNQRRVLVCSFCHRDKFGGVWVRGLCVVYLVSEMAQVQVKNGKANVVRTAVVKVATLDVERRIKQFEKTLIGRVWNPSFKNMVSLLQNMLKFWRLEGKVVGADLGDGRFHFNFQTEEELQEVLRNVPYHYESWMVSLVRWEPVVAPDYPSEITFWARVKGLPFQYGGAESLWAVGHILGHPSAVDDDAGFVRVTLNGFNPLIRLAIVPFDNGDEVEVQIDYERLANNCQHCLRITHLASSCPELCVILGRENGKKEEIMKMGSSSGEGYKEEGEWEVPRKKQMKRPLNQSDSGLNEKSGNQREGVRGGERPNLGHGNGNVTGRDGQFNRRDGSRNGTGFRAKESKPTMHGRGQGGSWLAPLYQAPRSQALVIRHDNKEMEHKNVKPVEMGKGKGKEVDNMDFDENIELDDDDLFVEEGVLGVGDYDIEDPRALISGSTSHGYEFTHEAEGNKNFSLKADGVEQLLTCSMDNAKVTMVKKGSQENLREKHGQTTNTGRMSITKKTGKVAIPKPPANM